MTRFRVILADCPWEARDQLPGPKRGAKKIYKSTMPIRDIMALRIPPTTEDALLFFWRVAWMVPEAYDVIRAWGFTAKSELVWVKTKSVEGTEIPTEGDEPEPGRMGMGWYSRMDHEVCIIAAKGRGAGLIEAHNVRSVVYAPKTPKHSEKPEATYLAIERLIGGLAPRVELFARQARPGWECFGNELGTEIGFGLLSGSEVANANQA